MWFVLFVATLVLCIIAIATFVLIRSRHRINRVFAVFAYLTAAWITANFIGANYKHFYFWNHAVHADFVLGSLAIYAFWYFTAVLLEQSSVNKRHAKVARNARTPLLLATFSAIAISFSPLAVHASYTASGEPELVYGPAFILYATISIVVLIFGLVNLILMRRFAEQRYKQQIRTISGGLVFAVLTVSIANLILPQLTESEAINLIAGNAAYIGVLVFVATTSYAIVRDRLFDLHLFVLRAGAYVASLFLVAIFYLVPVTLLVMLVFNLHFTVPGFVGVIICGVLIMSGYMYIRRWFDMLTSKIFFRNLYQPQEVLDTLSKLLVGTIAVDRIQDDSKRILQSALNTIKFDYILAGEAPTERLQLFEQLFHRTDATVIMMDEVESGSEVAEQCRTEGVAVVARLQTKQESLGFVVLGYKRSGEPYTADDKYLLSIAVDEIAISLQNSLRFEEIQHFNETLQQSVGEATRKLRQTNQKLRALDETKDDFITMASHQLRTPLTSVKGYLSMVLEGDVGKLNAQQRQLLTQSYLSSQRMVYLISDLLNLSRLNTGKFVIDLSPVDLGELVQSELDQLYETARAREVTLTYERPSGIPHLMLDETKIRQVIMNLIDNAIYYTPPGGHIYIEVRTTKAAVEFRVVDNGIGVPRAVQHRLFTKFYRAQNAVAARPDGTGLGLFMAKKVVVAQGGAIIFESEEGKGSTFGFRFGKHDHIVSGR